MHLCGVVKSGQLIHQAFFRCCVGNRAARMRREAAVQVCVAAGGMSSGRTLEAAGASLPWIAGGGRIRCLAWRVARPASRPAVQAAACGVREPQRAAAAARACRSMVDGFG